MNQSKSKKKRVLLVFVKDPVPGTVKTRLCPEFSPGQAAALCKAMAEDLLAAHAECEAHDTIVCFSPPESLDRMKAWLGEEAALVCQQGDDLGARMRNALKRAFDGEYEQAVMVGSDCPFIGEADIESAFEALDSVDLVIGPSEDGGYYLLGSSSFQAAPFEGINWGSETVLRETMERIEHARLSCRLLGMKYDIDSWVDAERLYSARGEAATEHAARNTIKVLASILAGKR